MVGQAPPPFPSRQSGVLSIVSAPAHGHAVSFNAAAAVVHAADLKAWRMCGPSLAVAERHCFFIRVFYIISILFIVRLFPPFLIPSCCFGSVLVIVAVYCYRLSFLFVSSSLFSLVFIVVAFPFFLSFVFSCVCCRVFFLSFLHLVSCVLFVVMGWQVLSCIHLITCFLFFPLQTPVPSFFVGFQHCLAVYSPPFFFLFSPLFLSSVRAVVPKTMAISWSSVGRGSIVELLVPVVFPFARL